MSDLCKLRHRIVTYFDINGYCLRNDSISLLLSKLGDVTPSEVSDWLDRISECLQNQPLNSSVIGCDTISQALLQCSQSGSQDSDFFNVINCYDVPRYTFNVERKRFVLDDGCHDNDDKDVEGGVALAHSKCKLFLERFQLIHQRTMRHSLFATSTLGKTNTFTLKPVEFLLGSTSATHSKIIVLGMITQLKPGVYFVEDPTGAVELDLSSATFKNGLFTENSFVLVEGSFEDSILKATAVGFPPPETHETSISHLGNVNFFGGSSPTCVRNSDKLLQLEQSHPDAIIVFLSDVWLAQIKVLEKLKILFSGYSESPPTAFVFMGNFVNVHKGKSSSKALKEALKSLSDMLSSFPTLVSQSRFVFVPGGDDPGMCTILPRPPIPQCVTAEFALAIPNCTFTSNPCRLQICSQEIVVMREDMLSKMCRNSINSPWQEDNVHLPTLLARTLVANATLCPLPLNVSPVYWSHDHSLRLYPLPNLVVIGDKCDPYNVQASGTTFINPGSFPRSDFSFKVYIPSTREIEESQICERF